MQPVKSQTVLLPLLGLLPLLVLLTLESLLLISLLPLLIKLLELLLLRLGLPDGRSLLWRSGMAGRFSFFGTRRRR